MIDATRILDLLVGGQPGDGVSAPMDNRPQAQPSGDACDLLQRARGMLDGVAGNIPSGLGGVAGAAAAGAITSLLLGSKAGREFAGEALKLGAAAALGGLAYRAYSNYRTGQPIGADTSASSVPAIKPSTLPAVTPANEHALLLVRAMIAAALSDGHLDETERSTIVGRLGALGVGSEERSFLDAEIAHPWSPAQFAAAAATPEQRAEIYLASAIAIDADTDAERAYLKYLAATLQLDEQLIAHLEDAVRQAKDGASVELAASAIAPSQTRAAI